MLNQDTAKQNDACLRCGAGSYKTFSRRIGGMERGYVLIFQCESCGYLKLGQVPQRSPKE